jgi:hypothetical protein
MCRAQRNVLASCANVLALATGHVQAGSTGACPCDVPLPARTGLSVCNTILWRCHLSHKPGPRAVIVDLTQDCSQQCANGPCDVDAWTARYSWRQSWVRIVTVVLGPLGAAHPLDLAPALVVLRASKQCDRLAHRFVLPSWCCTSKGPQQPLARCTLASPSAGAPALAAVRLGMELPLRRLAWTPARRHSLS